MQKNNSAGFLDDAAAAAGGWGRFQNGQNGQSGGGFVCDARTDMPRASCL